MIKYIDGKKVCSKCKEAKNVSQFNKWNNYKDGYYPSCKTCKDIVKKKQRITDPEYYTKKREWSKNNYQKHKDSINLRISEYQKKNPHIRKKTQLNFLLSQYGLTFQGYEDLLNKNDGKCHICNEYPNIRKLYVDHCHVSRKVRGALCNNCNAILGFSKEKIKILENAIRYLKENNHVMA